MKTMRVALAVVTLVLLLGTLSVSAAAPQSGTPDLTWSIGVLDSDEPSIMNLSTGFIGPLQIPILTYSKYVSSNVNGDLYRFGIDHLATEATDHECGPGNRWTCDMVSPGGGFYILNGSNSQMAITSVMGAARMGTAFLSENGVFLLVYTRDYAANMTLMVDAILTLVEMDEVTEYPVELSGSPSLVLEGDEIYLAYISRNPDTGVSSLVFAYPDPAPTNPCKAGLSYQCDIVTTFNGLSGTPSLRKMGDTIGIAYYDPDKSAVMYAYETSNPLYPANCGKAGDYDYRCLEIYSADEIGKSPQLDFGSAVTERGIVFVRDDTIIGHKLFYADYVGTGGNCGLDTGLMGGIYRYDCYAIADLTYTYNPSYSLVIDPGNYPVVAYDNVTGDYDPRKLYLTYPNRRAGINDKYWRTEEIDGAPDTTIATGRKASLALNSANLGFIGYHQQEDYVNPILKFALQEWDITFLPMIVQ